MTGPLVPQKAPYPVQESPRNVAWRQCGQSADQPYCDGSHKVTGIRPIVVELTENRVVKLCGFKRSGNELFSDGTRRSL